MDITSIRNAAVSENQIASRKETAKITGIFFRDVGNELEITGHFLGDDRRDGVSPFGHGNDGTVAIAMLLKIGSQLVSASADLISDGRHYAGASLVRQLVEVEYLAWAFESKNEESARWLRSTHDERRKFFTPDKLRKAAQGHFRSVDYGHHCEIGGHPTPGSWSLLNGDSVVAQLMLSDCLGHSGRIWDHMVGWAKNNPHGAPILTRSRKMSEVYASWKSIDLLTTLPAP